jgi:predicted GIY-YIG superfamily endonuclease
MDTIKKKIKENNSDINSEFIDIFYDTINIDNYCINLEDAFKWLGFSRVDLAKRLLIKPKIGFKINEDYIINVKGYGHNHNKETILIKPETFKMLAMCAQTDKGHLTRKYYIQMEQEYRKLCNNANKEPIQFPINEYYLNKEFDISGYKDKFVVYLLHVEKNIYKYGWSSNFLRRSEDHKSRKGWTKYIKVFDCKTIENAKAVETRFKKYLNHNNLSINYIDQNNDNNTEIFKTDKDLNDYINLIDKYIEEEIKKNALNYNINYYDKEKELKELEIIRIKELQNLNKINENTDFILNNKINLLENKIIENTNNILNDRINILENKIIENTNNIFKKFINNTIKLYEVNKKIVNEENEIINKENEISNKENEISNEENEISNEENEISNEENEISNEENEISNEENEISNEENEIINENEKNKCKCGKCKKNKELTEEFYRLKNNGTYTTYCIECLDKDIKRCAKKREERNKYNKEYKQKIKEKIEKSEIPLRKCNDCSRVLEINETNFEKKEDESFKKVCILCTEKSNANREKINKQHRDNAKKTGSDKKNYEKHKEQKLKHKKEKYIKEIDNFKEKNKTYYDNNREKILEQKRNRFTEKKFILENPTLFDSEESDNEEESEISNSENKSNN